MKKIKTVQAQRKFAAGAFINPPSVPPGFSQPERRIDPPQEPRVVQNCGMGATELLNVIMLRGIHTHMPVGEPVVLLERLNENGHNDNDKSCKSLRSQVINPEEDTKENLSENSKENTRKRRRSDTSVTDVEDNRPLNYFTRIKRRVTKAKTSLITRKLRVQKATVVTPSSRRLRIQKVRTRQLSRRLEIPKSPTTCKLRVEKVVARSSSRLQRVRKASAEPLLRQLRGDKIAVEPSKRQLRIEKAKAEPSLRRVEKSLADTSPSRVKIEKAPADQSSRQLRGVKPGVKPIATLSSRQLRADKATSCQSRAEKSIPLTRQRQRLGTKPTVTPSRSSRSSRGSEKDLTSPSSSPEKTVALRQQRAERVTLSPPSRPLKTEKPEKTEPPPSLSRQSRAERVTLSPLSNKPEKNAKSTEPSLRQIRADKATTSPLSSSPKKAGLSANQASRQSRADRVHTSPLSSQPKKTLTSSAPLPYQPHLGKFTSSPLSSPEKSGLSTVSLSQQPRAENTNKNSLASQIKNSNTFSRVPRAEKPSPSSTNEPGTATTVVCPLSRQHHGENYTSNALPSLCGKTGISTGSSRQTRIENKSLKQRENSGYISRHPRPEKPTTVPNQPKKTETSSIDPLSKQVDKATLSAPPISPQVEATTRQSRVEKPTTGSSRESQLDKTPTTPPSRAEQNNAVLRRNDNVALRRKKPSTDRDTDRSIKEDGNISTEHTDEVSPAKKIRNVAPLRRPTIEQASNNLMNRTSTYQKKDNPSISQSISTEIKRVHSDEPPSPQSKQLNKEGSPTEPASRMKRGSGERCAPGAGSYCGSCKRCSIMSNVIALGENMQTPSEAARVLGDLVDLNESPVPSPQARAPSPPDVYSFDANPAPPPSPFRRRPAPEHMPADSVDTIFGSRAPDTSDVIRVIETQTNVLKSYVDAAQTSDEHVASINKLIEILGTYKNKLVPQGAEGNGSGISKAEGGGGGKELRASPSLASDATAPGASADCPDIAEAPSFFPTMEEMTDLNAYVEKVEPSARKYGIFKIVPPRQFQPPCTLKNIQFKTTNQYISNMFTRWGPVASEMTTIKAHLATQNVAFSRAPLFDGIEVDLVKLYRLVKAHGGLIKVMEEHKWTAIADEMRLNAGRIKADVKLEKIYMKHLLPYETLSDSERKELRGRVEAHWNTRYKRQLQRAAQPLHRQQRLLDNEADSSDEEEPEPAFATAFLEAEDCVVSGTKMNLARFRRIGERVRDMRFPDVEGEPHWSAVEHEYWRLVHTGAEHVCVYGASLDTSQDAIGFPVDADAPTANHPWNLKQLGKSPRNVLSSLGATLAVTIPTLHLGMMFSTNCWHHDPHHLPWTEYMHQGPPKIWYGIADTESDKFRAAVEAVCPTAVQNKSIWLPSDTVMVPPQLLVSRGVKLARALQAPGEYVVVLPRAFSCSISTGLTVSESLYFASGAWLERVDAVFGELRSNAEPSMFAMEALLEGVARDGGSGSGPRPRVTAAARARASARAAAMLRPLLARELRRRTAATALGPALSPEEFLQQNPRCSKSSWQVVRDECDVCRCTLYWSKMIGVSGRSSVCLQHGLRLLESVASRDDSSITTILFYSNQQIEQLMADLDKRLK